MENSSSPSFTNLLNSPISSSDPQNPNSQQYPHFPPPQFPMNFQAHQYANNFHPHYSPAFNHFGVQSSYQHFLASSYHGSPFLGNVGQYPQGVFGGSMSNGPSSPVGLAAFFGTACGSGGDESASPPVAAAQKSNQEVVRSEECSDTSPDEGKKGGRMAWSEEQNKRLISAWLNNFNDPIDDNSKKSSHYWKQVADEYNKYAPKGQKRTPIQCKNHWNTTTTFVSKFNGCWIQMNNTYESGQFAKQLMEKTHQEYKRLLQTEKPFQFEHWWNFVKDEPKWRASYVVSQMSKRNKQTASGTYTSSSNQDTDEANNVERRRPQGHKAAKAERKGKRKGKATGSLSNENVQDFNGLQLRKTEAIEKMAAAAQEHAQAAKEHAQAISDKVAADKEKMKLEKNEELPQPLDRRYLIIQ